MEGGAQEEAGKFVRGRQERVKGPSIECSKIFIYQNKGVSAFTITKQHLKKIYFRIATFFLLKFLSSLTS